MSLEELYEKHEHYAEVTVRNMFPQITKFAKSNRLEPEDIYQFARMGLWNACKSYKGDKTRYSFKAHAIRNIKWYVLRSLQKETSRFQYFKKKKVENNKVALLSLSNNIDEDSDKTYLDIMSCDYINKFESDNPESLLFSSLGEKDVLAALRPKDLPYVKLRLEGHTFQQIANHFGVSKQAVNTRFFKIQEILNRKGIGVN